MLRRDVFVLAAAFPLAAFRPVPEDQARALIAGACADEADAHRSILASLEERLAVRFTDEQSRAMLDALRCPNCGCSLLAAWQDAQTAAARF
jgi:hypothetical protein